MKRAVPIFLLAVAAVAVCLGLGALGVNLYSARGTGSDLTTWKAPLDLIDPKHIGPADAVASLAGVQVAKALDDSLAQGDWEAGLALVAYTPDMNDADRAGSLLLLGSRYSAAKDQNKAAWCYQYAATLAVISPVPSDLTRVQTLLEAAQGLRALGVPSVARAWLDRAYLIAQYSASLPRDSRARALSQIGRAYQDAGLGALATQAERKSEEASSLQAEDSVAETHIPFRLSLVALPADAQLKDLTTARVTAAKELVDQLNIKGKSTGDLPTGEIRNLGDKLYYEDGTRLNYYQAQLKTASDAPTRVELLRDEVRWLSMKLRVARGGFGLSLVPEWESDAKNIAEALNHSQNELFQFMEQQAGSTDKAADADRQTEDVLRGELVAGRWAMYDYNESDLRSRLDAISQRLRDEQVPTLRLDAYQLNNQTWYLLVPDELFGQGERALPR